MNFLCLQLENIQAASSLRSCKVVGSESLANGEDTSRGFRTPALAVWVTLGSALSAAELR